MKDRRSVLRVYRFDCHVDRPVEAQVLADGFATDLRRNFEDCHLYQSEKRREDRTITRYTD